MNKQNTLSLLTIAVMAGLLTGCGDAETTIIELPPIVSEPDDHGHDHGSDGGTGAGGNDIVIDSLGRVAVLSEQAMSLSVVDLDDGTTLDSFPVTNAGSYLHASPSYRYAVVASRDAGTIEFIDGGMWQEDHTDHLHDYEQAPQASDYSLTGTKPTHMSSFDGQMTVFYDGDSDAGTPASVHVLTDADITGESDSLPTIEYAMNMHGVAKSSGEVVLATIRRDDSQSTSSNFTLPDQVGVYHWHDGEYELEQTLEQACPDLHGAAQNHDFFAFGCGDGVLVAHQHDDEFESVKIANIAELDGLRVGTLYGHMESELFFGIASSRATGERVFVSINPEANTMEAVEWESDATPVGYTFNYEGDKFVILDSEGHISKFELHEHDGELEFEFEGELHIAEGDVSTMPDGHQFTMAASKRDDHLYVADPIAQHILQIDLDEMSVEGDMELNVVPAKVIWLGIGAAHEEHDHSHD